MKDYFIRVYNNRVAVARIVKGEIEKISFSGEETLDITGFWDTFIDKIEYDTNDEISFIICSSDEAFTPHQSIKIAKKFETDLQRLFLIVSTCSEPKDIVCYYPDIKHNHPHYSGQHIQNVPTNISINKPFFQNEESLQAFFMKKTFEYKSGK